MTGFFTLIFIASVACFAIGIVKPSTFKRILKNRATRGWIAIIFGGVFFLSLIGVAITASPIPGDVVGDGDRALPVPSASTEPPSANSTSPAPSLAKDFSVEEWTVHKLILDSEIYYDGYNPWSAMLRATAQVQSFSNPKGEGVIVVAGQGQWIWLVSSDLTVYAVNGNAKALTPTAPLSLEHPSQVKYFDVDQLIEK